MSNKELYKSICEQPAGVPLFLQYWWLDAVCPRWDAAIVHNGDMVAGIWPYAVESKMGVKLRRTPQLTPYLGPHIFYPPDLKESKRDNFEHETIAALLDKMSNADVWNLALAPGLKQAGLLKAKAFEVQVRQTFLMDLSPGEEIVFTKLNEDYRRNIRKAFIELNITNEPGVLPMLYEFQQATMGNKDLRLYYDLGQMQRVFEACKANNCTSLWVAKKNDAVQAIVWEVWDNERAYYLAGAKNPKEKDNRAMTALLWHAIRDAIRRNKKWFDFEGSMDPGVEKFFRNFGAERELYLNIKKNSSTLWKLKEWLG